MGVPFSVTALYSLYLQTNIRIDDQGTARIAGFASASIILHPDIALEDVDESVESNVSRWCSPEILHPGGFGLTKARATKGSDIYAFGMLAYEVGSTFRVIPRCYSIRA
jgi:hypothetical protein